MSWQVLMLAQNVLAAIFAVNSRIIAKRFTRAAVPLNLLVFFITALSGLAYASIVGLNNVSGEKFQQYLGLFVLAGICFAITNVLSFIVFQYVDAAIASLFSIFNIIAAVLASTLVINESLTWLQLAGAALILFAMELILTLNVTKFKHKKLWMALSLSFVAGVFFAIAVTIEKYLLNRVNLPTYLVFGWGFQFVGLVVVTLLCMRYIRPNFQLFWTRKFWNLALPASLIRMSGGLLFILSLRLANNLSVISVLSGLKVVFAALIGAYLLKEREYLSRKYEAAVVACIGIALIYWR